MKSLDNLTYEENENTAFPPIFSPQNSGPWVVPCKECLLSFSRQVMSDSLRPHGLQHARPPRPSLSPGVCSNSCPLSRRCQPTILSTVAPFSSCPQSFPGPASFPMSWLFISGGQRVGASVSASVLPMKRAQSLGDTSFVRPSWSFTKHTILLMSLKGSAGKKYVELCHHFPCLFQPLSSSLKE